MIWLIKDIADHVPFRSAPPSSDRVDIDGPALQSARREQPWTVLRVFATTDEQHFAATAPNDGDQLTIKMSAILTIDNPKIAKPHVEATASGPREKPTRYPAPQAASRLLFHVARVANLLHPHGRRDLYRKAAVLTRPTILTITANLIEYLPLAMLGKWILNQSAPP